jgi:hypothetical protein
MGINYHNTQSQKVKTGGDKMKKLLLTIFLVGAVLFSGCIFAPVKTPFNPNTITPTPTTTDITAAKLVKAYKDDAAAANKLYLGKELAVEGIVKEYGQETGTNYPYLLVTVSVNDTTGVYCTFPDGYEKLLPQLKIGQGTTITGKCRGIQNGNVILDSRY